MKKILKDWRWPVIVGLIGGSALCMFSALGAFGESNNVSLGLALFVNIFSIGFVAFIAVFTGIIKG